MASPNTLRSHAKSLHKRGMITDKQHERMLDKIAAMAPPPGGPTAAPADPALDGASNLPSAPAVPATASVPPGATNASPVPPAQPPAT